MKTKLPVLNYKIGDRVIVRDDLEISCDYFDNYNRGYSMVVQSMYELRGEVVTITEIVGTAYRIDEDSTWWRDSMFEGYASPDKDFDLTLLGGLFK